MHIFGLDVKSLSTISSEIFRSNRRGFTILRTSCTNNWGLKELKEQEKTNWLPVWIQFHNSGRVTKCWMRWKESTIFPTRILCLLPLTILKPRSHEAENKKEKKWSEAFMIGLEGSIEGWSHCKHFAIPNPLNWQTPFVKPQFSNPNPNRGLQTQSQTQKGFANPIQN